MPETTKEIIEHYADDVMWSEIHEYNKRWWSEDELQEALRSLEIVDDDNSLYWNYAVDELKRKLGLHKQTDNSSEVAPVKSQGGKE